MLEKDWRTRLRSLPNEARLHLIVVYREIFFLKRSFAEGEMTKEQFVVVREILEDLMPQEPL